MSELPPLEQPQAYVVVGPNDQRGPYTLDLLIGEVVAGRLSDATPVWWPGLAEWTTMNAHPGVAAEIGRRRALEAAPAAEPSPAPTETQYAQPEPAPAPASYAQPEAAPASYAQPEAAPASYAQPEAAPASYAQPEAAPASYAQPEPAPASYAQPEPAPAPASYAQPEPSPTPGTFDLGEQPSPASAPGTFDAGQQPGDPADQWGAPADAAPAADVVPGTSSTPAGWTVTDTSRSAEAPGGIVEAEVVDDVPAVVDTVDVRSATGDGPVDSGPVAAATGSTVTDEHRNLFQRLVERSRHRSHAGDRVAAIDAALTDAVVSGAESQGFAATDRTDGEVQHELRFDGGPGETLAITLGRVKGDDPDKARTGQVPISVRFQSATYAGGLETGTGDHGEVVIVSDEWSGQATSTVSLLLALEDYVDGSFEVDVVSVLRDVGATVSVVSGRMR